MTELSSARVEAISQKEKLSDEQLGNLLSSVGNHEAKALTLLSMGHDRVYSKYDLFREFIKRQGNRVGWKPSRSIPFGYCQKSLAPIGLVAREEMDPGLKTYGYGITEYGERIGISLAGLLLDFSEKHPEVSLVQLFGSTSSSSKSKNIETPQGDIEFKKRAPVTRLKIFREFVTRKNLRIREIDLINAIGERPGHLDAHLSALKNYNLITYESRGTDQSYSFFKLSLEKPAIDPQPHRTDSSLTQEIYQFFINSNGKWIDSDEIVNHVIKTNLEKRYLNIKRLKHRVSSICQHLKREKYLEQGKFGNLLKSEITLLNTQESTFFELVTLIDKFQRLDPETLEEGRQKAMAIVNNPEKVSNLMKKAKESSGQANQLPIEESAQYILSIIVDHTEDYSNGLTNTQIYELQDRKPKLSRAFISKITRYLKSTEKIIVLKEKSQKYFKAIDIKETQASK